MSIFKHLGEAPINLAPLANEVAQAIDSDLIDSWAKIPHQWKTSVTQEQVAEFLEGVAAKHIRAFPDTPAQPILLYLLTKASSLIVNRN